MGAETAIVGEAWKVGGYQLAAIVLLLLALGAAIRVILKKHDELVKLKDEHITALELRLKRFEDDNSALHTARLADYQALVPVVTNNTAALQGNTEVLEAQQDEQVNESGGRRREPTGNHKKGIKG